MPSTKATSWRPTSILPATATPGSSCSRPASTFNLTDMTARPLSWMLRSLLFSAFILGGMFAADAARPPNILFILTDDQGWGDAVAFGHPYLKTPNIDRLTREGTRFHQFYTASPVCSPSRTGFLTGQYPA